MFLKPLDLVVAIKLSVVGPQTYARLAEMLGISTSQAHASIKRLRTADLLATSGKVVGRRLYDVLLAAPYLVPAENGPACSGTPTGWGAPIFREQFPEYPYPPVWPSTAGDTLGRALEPIHSSAPLAANDDGGTYDRLALVDALRVGQAREREFAREKLADLLWRPRR